MASVSKAVVHAQQDTERAQPAATPLRAAPLAAVFFCGMFAFLDLYCTQPMLPMLAKLFGATETHVGITISASTIGVAVSAALLALFGERLRRKPTIVIALLGLAFCSLLTATAHSLNALAVWRMLQGLATPGVFILAIAYVTEEWPAAQVPRAMSTYVSGTVFGGFVGRLLGGVIAQHWGWQAVFMCLGVGGILGAALIAWLLPPSRMKSATGAWTLAGALAPVKANARNPRLLATFGLGFCMLFTLIATFSFVTFYLAAPPFNLTTEQLSGLFAVYLVGLVATLIAGAYLMRIGLRRGMLLAIAMGICGILLTLVHSLLVIGVALALASSCVFIAQTCANSFLRDAAPQGARVSAAGMYICAYYIGGTVGGLLPGPVWRAAAWPGCVALVAVVLMVAGVIAYFGWKAERVPEPVPL